jgi:hypothetical protein
LNTQDLLKGYPGRRIKPFDGLAVTSDIWEEAHEYHRLVLRYHNLMAHTWGIVVGLEVMASDPADGSVYILPGMATDSSGQTVVLREPLTFDMGQAEGVQFLVLSYEEGQPHAGECGQVTDVLYVDSQFGLEARSSLPAGPHLELARVRRHGRNSVIKDAVDAGQPAANQIDLRYRRDVHFPGRQVATVAVCYTGGGADRRHGRGTAFLAQALNRQGQLQVWLDDNVALSAGSGLGSFALVYLVGQDSRALKPDEMNALYAYMQGGGTVLVESCRQGASGGAAPADLAFTDLFASLGIKLEALPAGHRLLTSPALFTQPPAGFETEGSPQVLVSDAVIFSTFDHGCLWQGQRRPGPASREEIRSAMEWGGNILDYALWRRQKTAVP